MKKFEFDIAISFANAEREIAYKLASILTDNYKLKIFYDDFEQARLLGENLTEYLLEVYLQKSRYCIILISKEYKLSRWSRHEWRAAQSRAFSEPDIKYLIPVRVDDTVLPGLLDTVSYLPLYSSLTIENVANIIYTMVQSEVEKLNIVRVARDLYDNGQFQRALDLVNDEQLDESIEALRIRGDAYAKMNNYPDSITALVKIRALQPHDFLAHFLLGIFYYRIGDFENSVASFEIAQKMNPDNPTIKSDLPAARRQLKLQKFKKFLPWK